MISGSADSLLVLLNSLISSSSYPMSGKMDEGKLSAMKALSDKKLFASKTIEQNLKTIFYWMN